MELNPGEKACPHCYEGKYWSSEGGYFHDTMCDFCKGKGKLDWIEQIVGVKEEPIKLSFSHFGIQHVLHNPIGLINITGA